MNLPPLPLEDMVAVVLVVDSSKGSLFARFDHFWEYSWVRVSSTLVDSSVSDSFSVRRESVRAEEKKSQTTRLADLHLTPQSNRICWPQTKVLAIFTRPRAQFTNPADMVQAPFSPPSKPRKSLQYFFLFSLKLKPLSIHESRVFFLLRTSGEREGRESSVCLPQDL